MNENNSFKPPELSQVKKTNIAKSGNVGSISISPVGSQTSSLNESVNSFETKILFEETEDSRQEEFEKNANPLRSTEENKQKPITKTINPKTINVEMPTKENESVPFHNLQRGRSLKLFDIPTPPNQVLSSYRNHFCQGCGSRMRRSERGLHFRIKRDLLPQILPYS